MEIARFEQREQFTTLDGSSVREIVGPAPANANNLSIAEASVPAGGETIEHLHRRAEEVYFFVAGVGRMRLEGEEASVRAGDTVVIAPGSRHKLWNEGSSPLTLLCFSAPPYTDADTILCER